MKIKITILLILLPVLCSNDEFYFIHTTKEKKSKGVAFSKNNPGSIKKNGRFVKYETLEEGLNAHRHLLYLYISGKSRYTDSSTIIWAAMTKYIGNKNSYQRHLIRDLNCDSTTLISQINIDSLQKYIIKYENINMYRKLFE